MFKFNYKVYTLDQVADILQFNIERVIELVVNGELGSIDAYHVSAEDLQDYIDTEDIGGVFDDEEDW